MPATQPAKPTRPSQSRRPQISAPLQEPAPGRVAVGRILRPWGVHGELRVEPLTDFPRRFDAGERLWIGEEAHVVTRSRPHKGAVLLQLQDVDAAIAEALRDKLIEIPEAEVPELPADTYYRYQLLGMEVRSTAGDVIGQVEDVFETGANDVLVVRGEAGEALIPAIGDIVQVVDLAERRITIEVVDGLLTAQDKPLPRRRSQRRHNKPGPTAAPG